MSDELKPFIVAVTFTKTDGYKSLTALRHGRFFARSEDEALGRFIREEEPDGDCWSLGTKSVFACNSVNEPDARKDEAIRDFAHTVRKAGAALFLDGFGNLATSAKDLCDETLTKHKKLIDELSVKDSEENK